MYNKLEFAYEYHEMKHGWQCDCSVIKIMKMVDSNSEFDEFIIKKLGGEIKK